MQHGSLDTLKCNPYYGHFLRLCGHFAQKSTFLRSHLRRITLIRSALESLDLGAFSDGSTVKIRALGTDLVTFEVAGTPKTSTFSAEIFVN